MSEAGDSFARRESRPWESPPGGAARPWCPVPPPALPPEQEFVAEPGLADLHESISTLLASRDQWQQAYQHLRAATDLRSAREAPRVPEQLRLRDEVDRLRREHAEAREQSLRDSLTAGYNRRYLDERLAELLVNETWPGFGLALVDLDWFKRVNDTYGHVVGDRVLRRVVVLLEELLPPGASCARYGGEEFALVLPGINRTEAIRVCDRARQKIERHPWSQLAPELAVTVSIGISHHAPGEHSSTVEQQLLNADVLLYSAKRAGRNAVAYRVGNTIRVVGPRTESRPAAAAVSHY